MPEIDRQYLPVEKDLIVTTLEETRGASRMRALKLTIVLSIAAISGCLAVEKPRDSSSPATLLDQCADDSLNVGQCVTSSSRYVTSSSGAAVAGVNGALSNSIPLGFYDGTTTCSMSDTNLIAANIKSGITIFGVEGSVSTGIPLASNAHRDLGVTPISQTAETTTYAGAALPNGYHDVPDILKDDDGYFQAGSSTANVVLVDRSSFVNCGTALNSITARIADCAVKNGVSATWDGAVKGNAGQGVWKLVTRADANKEVWQDQRTGLLWSSIVSTSSNWCRASGNAQANDPQNWCNNSAYQADYPVAQSWCAEEGPTQMKEVSGSGENWASGVYSSAKGGMGKTSAATSPSVRWRIPTRYDYQLADNHGLRFVVPDFIASVLTVFEWTSTLVGDWSGSVYMIENGYGEMVYGGRNGNRGVRCVGR